MFKKRFPATLDGFSPPPKLRTSAIDGVLNLKEIEFKGRRRQLMTPNRYTELFFLDEATALAAGHKPCGECRNKRYKEFVSCWTKANPELTENGKITSRLLDIHLHKERVASNKQKLTYVCQIDQLPDAVFISLDDSSNKYYLKWLDQLLLWTAGGYNKNPDIPSEKTVTVLTPQSVVKTIAQGYNPIVHPSVESI